MPTVTRASRPRFLAAMVAVISLTLAGCGATTGPAAASPSAPPTAATPTPSDPAASTDPAGGGTSDDPGASGAGVGGPVDPTPVDPGAGQPALVVPVPGRLDPHPVAPTALQASVDGRHVLVKVSWYGGIEPCSVLDSVTVERGDHTIALTVIEGTSDRSAICPEIAMLKATIVDIGELEPGAWTISASTGDAAPIQLTID
jgi:hypothetical protein